MALPLNGILAPSGAGGGAGGDVVGPASSTDNAIVRYDGTTGKLIQNSAVTIDDSNVVSGVTQLNVDNLRLDGNTLSSTDTNSSLLLESNGTGYVQIAPNVTGDGKTIARFGGTVSLYLNQMTGASFAFTRSPVNNPMLSINTRTESTPKIATGSGGQFVWLSTIAFAEEGDTGLARNAAGVIRVTDGLTGIGSILAKQLVEANTAGSGSPNVIVATESGTLYTNEGTSAENYHTLPSAAAGLIAKFAAQDVTNNMRIVPASGDVIVDSGGLAATSSGYIQSLEPYSYIVFEAMNSTEWVISHIKGIWRDDAGTVYNDTGLTS